MAEAEGAGTASPPGSIRLPFIVMGVLIVLFVVGGILAKKEKPKPFKTEGSRAVVLPAGDRKRVVVVPPCSTAVPAPRTNHSVSGPEARPAR